MANTPEAMVKNAVRKVFREFDGLYYFMPVQMGYGAPALDFIGCYHGRCFGIETKAKGKVPTPRQLLTIEMMKKSGAATFVVQGVEGTEELKSWLTELQFLNDIGK